MLSSSPHISILFQLVGGTIGLSIWAIVCRGSRELAHTWANIGASDDGDGGGGGDDSCDSGDPYDGGDGGPGLGGHDNRCFEQRYARSTSRKLQIEDCSTECSRGELKLAFQAIKSRELDLLGAESKLNICANEAQSSDGIKSIFPCVLKQALDILPTIPLASKVVSCILRNRPCYGDLSNKPGLLNLLIQSGRFQSMLRLILLVYGGRLSGVPASIYTNGTDLLNRTQLENFGTGIVDGLSDTSEQGRAFSPSELNQLLNVGFDLPNEADIRYFADTWNRSLLLWDEDVISSNDLPENYSYGFFDLSAAASLIEEFQEDRLAVRNEGFSGFSDAFLKAVEGQQFEEARILAGICANVRIRISQELTMTRVGFEAQLEISNDLSSPLEGLSVSLRVNPFLNYSEDATDVFVIGAPDLYKISSIEGNGTLAGRTKGLVTWLMLPLTEAAPQFDTRYDGQ